MAFILLYGQLSITIFIYFIAEIVPDLATWIDHRRKNIYICIGL